MQSKNLRKKKKSGFGQWLLTFLARLSIFLVVTALLAAGALYCVMHVLVNGPSPSARNLFVRSVKETSAGGFLANLYLSQEEIDEILMGSNATEPEYQETDTGLIQLPKPTEPSDSNAGPQPDAWGLIDEDGDGLIIENVRGSGYAGKLMVVLDPSRVLMGCVPKSFGTRGYTVKQFAERFDAVAAINAGGFEDAGGQGNGSEPDSMVVFEGKTYYANKGYRDGFVGFDSNHIMHVGKLSAQDIKDRNIQYGACFGPVLVNNGEPCDMGHMPSGVNPRTAIGQRSDGAVLLLVIDGRQVSSLGATFGDLVEIMMSYGAVNACNLDGGSSSLLYHNGEYINNCASLVGIRAVPTSFVVLKKEAAGNG